VKTRLRHAAYWAFTAVVFLPFLVLAIAARLFERLDDFCGRVRSWAYQERYARWPG
jgi:hypothetical protein